MEMEMEMRRERKVISAPRLATDRSAGGFITGTTRSSTAMSSVLVSTASKASKILVSASASAATAVTGEGERWRAMDHLRYLFMLSVWVNLWILRVIVDFFASRSADPLRDARFRGGFVDTERPSRSSSSSVGAMVLHGGEAGNGPRYWSSSTTAIGRALSHALEILNETPSTSRKYEFVLATSDKIITDSLLHHSSNMALLDVNRSALSAAFSRTCDLLRHSLSLSLKRSSDVSTATWPSRLLRLLPLGLHLSACYDTLRLSLKDLINERDGCWKSSMPSPAADYSCSSSSTGKWLQAEKLAHELLWITKKMKASSMEGEAVFMWGFASGLASLSLTAHPRVQTPIIEISVGLFHELARAEWEASREVRFRLLAVWLPLLCYATSNGVASPVLVGLERWETERVVEDLISGLPLDDQEILLGNWLQDFISTDSDWPNLKTCFHRWCQHSRELLCC